MGFDKEKEENDKLSTTNSEPSGHLLSRGLKFSSQTAFLRFAGLPGKRKRGKKRSKEDTDLDDVTNNFVVGYDESNTQIDVEVEGKTTVDTKNNTSPPPIPPPRKKKRADDPYLARLKKELNKDPHVVSSVAKESASDVGGVKKVKKNLAEEAKLKLSASRFRYLNEQMYCQPGNASAKMFRSDPDLFSSYHTGYQNQARQWPLDPLDIIIADCSKLPGNKVVADFGCGEARLASSLAIKVHSLDLVAANPTVTACDMANTSLDTASVDVVVFCLSLMGTNLRDFLFEACRVLKMSGELKIAELESRFQGREYDVEKFIHDVGKFGFKNTKKDLKKDFFYFLDFQKIRDMKNKKKTPEVELKPCMYKKR